MATYPENPNIPQGTNETAVNPTNWNLLVDNINAIGLDLLNARSDGQEFPGTDHTAGQAENLDDMIQGIKHMLTDISGEANWYDIPAANLKSHDHSSDKGGAIPWSSIASNTRFVELHPEYPGAILTTSLRGAIASGNNAVSVSTGQDVISYVAHNYCEAVSSEASLQDYYIALKYKLREDFGSWMPNNAIQIGYKTESETYLNSYVNAYIYKSGDPSLIYSNNDNSSTSWSTITLDDSAIGSWSAGDVMEIYLKLATRNGYYARVGKIIFNYSS